MTASSTGQDLATWDDVARAVQAAAAPVVPAPTMGWATADLLACAPTLAVLDAGDRPGAARLALAAADAFNRVTSTEWLYLGRVNTALQAVAAVPSSPPLRIRPTVGLSGDSHRRLGRMTAQRRLAVATAVDAPTLTGLSLDVVRTARRSGNLQAARRWLTRLQSHDATSHDLVLEAVKITLACAPVDSVRIAGWP